MIISKHKNLLRYRKFQTHLISNRWSHYILIILAFLLLTIAFTWPLALSLNSKVIGGRGGDPYFVFMVVSQFIDKIVHLQFTDFWDSQMFYPYSSTFLFSDHSLGMAIQLLPLAPWRDNFVLLENATILMSFWISGIGGYLLGLHYFKRKHLAFLCALLIAFNPYHLALSGHMQIFVYHFLPFVVVYYEKLLKTPSIRNALLFVIFFVWNASMSIYLLIASFFLLVIIGFGRLVFKEINWSKKSMRIYFLCGLVAILLVGLLYKDYVPISELHNVSRTPEESAQFSARPFNYLISLDNHIIEGGLSSKIKSMYRLEWSERTLYLGFSIVGLSLFGLFRGLRKNSKKFIFSRSINSNQFIFLTVVLFAVVFAFGPVYYLNDKEIKLPFGYLYDWLFFIKATRAPTRIHVITVIALAVLAVYGFIRLKKILFPKGVLHKFLFAVILIAIVLDLVHTPLNIAEPYIPDPAEYSWASNAEFENDVFLHFPTYAFTTLVANLNYIDQKSIGGYSGIFPESIITLMAETNTTTFSESPEDQLIAAANIGATHFVFHRKWSLVGIKGIDQDDFRKVLLKNLEKIDSIQKVVENNFVTVYDITSLKDDKYSLPILTSDYELSEKNIDFYIRSKEISYVTDKVSKIEINIEYKDGEVQSFTVYKPLYVPIKEGYKFRFNFRDLKDKPENIKTITFEDI